MNTSQKGNVATAHILAALAATGKYVAIPFGDNQRYDLIVEDEQGKLLKVQCKTGRLVNGVIVFMVSSNRRKTKHQAGGWVSYQGQIDLFGVYCPQVEASYLVPVEDVKKSAASLRVEPPRNSQVKGIRWAATYQLGVVAQLGARINGIDEVVGSIPTGSIS